MSELSDKYKQALEIDFIKFTTFVMLGYFLKKFRNPEVQMNNIIDAWSKRVHDFRTKALNDCEDPDVAKILTSIVDLDEGLDRNASIKEVQDHFRQQIGHILKTF